MHTSHFDITGRPDMGKVFEMMGQLPEEDKAGMCKLMQERMQVAAEASTQDGLIERFKKQRAQMVSGSLFSSSGAATCGSVSWTTSNDVKPSGPQEASKSRADALDPIRVRDLEVGATQRGRRLCGRVAVDDAYFQIASTVFLLEDVTGEMVEVAVYNIPQACTEKVARIFPRGRGIAILEPFFKNRQDMTQGIRVDAPQEIVDWTFPATCPAWKELGNSFVRSKIPKQDAALFCYDAALTRLPPEHLQAKKDLAVLWTNAATCHFQLGDFVKAAQCAAVGRGLDPGNIKAWYRLAEALFEVGGEAASSLEPQRGGKWAGRALSKCAAEVFKSSEKSRKHFTDLLAKHGEAASVVQPPFSKLDLAAWCIVPGIVEWTDPASSAGFKSSSTPWAQLKKSGGEHFCSGRYRAALECYVQAIHCHEAFRTIKTEAAVVLSNKAAAHLMSEASSEALQRALADSCVSTLLEPSNVKAWVRQSRCLERLGAPELGLERLRGLLACAAAAPLAGDARKELEQLERRCESRQKAKPVSGVPTEQQYRERRQVTASEDPGEGIDEYIARMEQMRVMCSLARQQAKGKGKRKEVEAVFGPLAHRSCPEFHLEFPKERGWPEGLDAVFAGKVLYRSFLNAESHPWMTESVMRKGQHRLQPEQLVKRWHGTAAFEVMRGMASLAPGDVVDARHLRGGALYDARIRSNFANNPNRTEILFFGTTHVSVGFNDLGCLLSCVMQEPTEEEYRGRPLRFVGFEMSEFSVAKSLVVAEMLSDESVPLDHILQVWYSSGWSRPALASFERCTQTVLARQEADAKAPSYNAKVASYLHHWLSAEPLSAGAARQRWFANVEEQNSKVFGEVATFRRKQDRLALCHYLLTGEVLRPGSRAASGDAEKAAVGSKTMWTVPAGSPPLEEDIAFNAVTLEDLLQGLQEQPQHDVFDLLVAKVLRDLARVREHLQAGRLAIELFHGVLKPVGEPGGAELIRRIAALRPYTMSWSNVLDYFPLEDFHEAARRCSVHGDTVHYGYSMNWVTEVFGTSISDFEGQQEVTNSILDMSLHGPAEEFGRLSGIDSLLSVPFFDTPLNLCGYVLAQCFHGKWLDFFFEKADVSLARMRRSADSPPGAGGGSGLSPGNQGLSRGSGCMMLPCPLYRTTVAVYMSWTYDSNLKLQSFHDNKYDSLFGALNAAF